MGRLTEETQSPSDNLPPLCSIDIETQGDIKQLHHSQRRLLSVALCFPDSDQTFVIPEEALQESWPELLELLSHFRLIAHHGKFDLATLCIMLGAEPDALELYADTLLMHYVLYPAGRNHGLKALLYQYLGWTDWSDELFPDMSNLAASDRDALYEYNAIDAIGTGHLYFILASEFEDNSDAQRSLRVRMKASELFQWMEPQGMGFDVHYARGELAERLTTLAENYRIECTEMAHRVVGRTKIVKKRRQKKGEVYFEDVEVDREFNPGSWQQILEVYEAAGIPLPDTSADTLTARVADGDMFAQTLLDWRHVQKQLTAFVRPLVAKTSMVLGTPLLFPSYKIHGTRSSRLSAENPNVQQMPRDPAIRKAFVARGEDRLLAEVDYGQGELRVIAAVANDPWLLELFHNPAVDVFDQMLPTVFPKINFENIDKAQKKELRAKLKGVVYGLNFGRGAAAIALAINSSVQEAQRIIDTFFDNASGVAVWRDQVMKDAVRGEPILTRFGSRFHYEVVTPMNRKDVQRSALSHCPQGNLSDMNLLSACRMRQHIKDKQRPWNIAALVHDAVILDVPKDDAEEAAALMAEYMQGTAKTVFPEVPFATDAKFGKSWAETA